MKFLSQIILFCIALICLATSATFFAHAYNNGAWLAGLPPRGVSSWCLSHDVVNGDWCGLIDKCSYKELKVVADSMVSSGMRDAGYNLLQLDDCWSAKTRDANGNLQADKDRFPKGIEQLVDYVHSLGMKIGLYLCVGTKTCRNGLPGSYDYYLQDARWIKEKIVDYVKIDNCNRPGGYSEFQLYSNFSRKFVENGAGRVVLDLCEWGTGDAATLGWPNKIAQLYRYQMDHLPFFWLPTRAAGAGINQGTHGIIEYTATLPRNYSSVYNWGDPDFLMTMFSPWNGTYTMSFIESRTEFSFWSLWSAPLIMATSPVDMPVEKKSIVLNKKVLDINHDPLGTPGWRVFNETSGAQLWLKKLNNGDIAAIFYNSQIFSEKSVYVTAIWNQIPEIREDVKSMMAIDLWNNNTSSSNNNNNNNNKDKDKDKDQNSSFNVTSVYSVSVAPRDVQMLRITCDPSPCLKSQMKEEAHRNQQQHDFFNNL